MSVMQRDIPHDWHRPPPAEGPITGPIPDRRVASRQQQQQQQQAAIPKQLLSHSTSTTPASPRFGASSPRGTIRLLNDADTTPMVQGAPPSFSCVYTNKGRGEFRLRRSALHYDTDTRKRDSKLAEPTARNVATPSTRAHQVATKQWQQQAAVMSDSGSIGSFRSARGTRSRPRAYDPVKYRTEAAVREGRAVEDEGYYSARLAIQASIKEHEKQQAAQRWEKVKPWLEAKASPRPTTVQRNLRAARKELAGITKLRDERRKKWETRARQFLKDIVFLLEKLEKMDDYTGKDEIPAHQKFVHGTTQMIRSGTLNEASLNNVEQAHKAIIRELFELMDEDGGGSLDHGEIKKLAKSMGAKLTDEELNTALVEMDADGSGEVDFGEFYDWWSQDKDAGILTQEDEGQSAFFSMEIVPLEYT